jgi:hypothetical protein
VLREESEGREEVLVRSWAVVGEDLEARFVVVRVVGLLEESAVRRLEDRRVEEVDVRGVEDGEDVLVAVSE